MYFKPFYHFEMKNFVLLLLVFTFLLLGCNSDQMQYSDIDVDLELAIKSVSPTGKIDYFQLPQPDDYASIPQHHLNPLSSVKVELGKMLFFETGLGIEAVYDENKGTFSCATCHIPTAGFRPGRSQGIADGGLGYGINGEGRIRDTKYNESEMDVQGIRPLSVLNSAFVTNTLWNGSFGGDAVNVGTEDVWDDEEITMVNHLGYGALESQNIEGLELHRMVIDKDLMDQYGYTPMFDAAFPEFSEDERYTRTTGSFAISAYLRTLFPNEAPFQKWIGGDKNAMTDEEKRGALVFFTKAQCTNCHIGKAFSDTEFYAIGVNDLNMQPSFNEGCK